MAQGGARPGSGPKRSPKRITKKAQTAAVIEAKKGGHVLPHEILLRAANGECFKQKRLEITYYKAGPNKGHEKSRQWVEEDYWPTVHEQIDAAKAAAPYYAPRLATQLIKTDEQTAEALTAVMKELAGKLPG